MTIDFEKDQTEVLDKTTNINKLADKIKEMQAVQKAIELDEEQIKQKKKGLEAKAYTKEMLSRNDGKFTVKSHGVGKYGRLLGEIFIEGEDKSLNQLLIDNGHAYEYDGGKKKVLGG